MGQAIVVVDAFTDRPFSGNPAAVTILDGERPDSWLQAVAAEMNLAETAFLRPVEPGVWDLRWFTPTTEVELCGHATLASAHVLWGDGHDDEPTLRFRTRSGELRAIRADGWIWLDFPRLQPRDVIEPYGLAETLGSGADVRSVVTGGAEGDGASDLLVELGSTGDVRALAPDLSAVALLPYRGLIVTAPGEDGIDFVSRFFAPTYGIPEDPVTGSAHCLLAPFWGDRLGKDRMVARQISRRGGDLIVELRGDRVLIGGRAVTVMRSELVGVAARHGAPNREMALASLAMSLCRPETAS